MRRSLALLLGLGLALFLGGCSSIPLGPVTEPEIYPDRTEDEATLHTFLWAWNTGDVAVLKTSLGALLLQDLIDRLERNGEASVSAFYKGSGDLTIEELEWIKQTDALAYVRVVLKSSKVTRAEMDFSLYRRPGGWVVTGQRLLR